MSEFTKALKDGTIEEPGKIALREALLNAPKHSDMVLAQVDQMCAEVCDLETTEGWERAKIRAKGLRAIRSNIANITTEINRELKELPTRISNGSKWLRDEIEARENKANAGLKRIEEVQNQTASMNEMMNAYQPTAQAYLRDVERIKSMSIDSRQLPAEVVSAWREAHAMAQIELSKKARDAEAAEKLAEENARKAAEADELARKLAQEQAARKKAEREAAEAESLVRKLADDAEKRQAEDERRRRETETTHDASSSATKIEEQDSPLSRMTDETVTGFHESSVIPSTTLAMWQRVEIMDAIDKQLVVAMASAKPLSLANVREYTRHIARSIECGLIPWISFDGKGGVK
jgi:hypothetical protein